MTRRSSRCRGLHKSRALGDNTFHRRVRRRLIVRGLPDQERVLWPEEQSIAKDGSPIGHLREFWGCVKTKSGAEKVRSDVELESQKV